MTVKAPGQLYKNQPGCIFEKDEQQKLQKKHCTKPYGAQTKHTFSRKEKNLDINYIIYKTYVTIYKSCYTKGKTYMCVCLYIYTYIENKFFLKRNSKWKKWIVTMQTQVQVGIAGAS